VKEILVAFAVGLLVNEFYDICPRVAVWLVRWAARLQYPEAPGEGRGQAGAEGGVGRQRHRARAQPRRDHGAGQAAKRRVVLEHRQVDGGRAAIRGEELAALINDRPGNLFKLLAALDFIVRALIVTGFRTAPRGAWRLRASASSFANDHLAGLRRFLVVAVSWAAGVIGVLIAADYMMVEPSNPFVLHPRAMAWAGMGAGAMWLAWAIVAGTELTGPTFGAKTEKLIMVTVEVLVVFLALLGGGAGWGAAVGAVVMGRVLGRALARQRASMIHHRR
jgi:hypothetical protein